MASGVLRNTPVCGGFIVKLKLRRALAFVDCKGVESRQVELRQGQGNWSWPMRTRHNRRAPSKKGSTSTMS
eukprot:2194261-Alexandrium_andersonii.AAC.1